MHRRMDSPQRRKTPMEMSMDSLVRRMPSDPPAVIKTLQICDIKVTSPR